ncbi:MAG: hypothetical protein ACAH83_00800 [Alphaproteobacteria bacterium]
MTSELSSKSRQELVDKAADAGKKSRTKAKHGFWTAVAGIAAAVVATAVLPASVPATLLLVGGSIVSIFGATDSAGHYLNQKSMEKVQKDLTGEKPLENLSVRSSRFKNILAWADKVEGVTALGALAGLVAAVFVPVVAPVAWPVYYGLFSGYLAASLTQRAVRLAEDDVTYLSRSAEYAANGERLAAAAADRQPAAQVLAPSPSPAFENAANGNTPPAAAPDVAPEKKLAPPTP